MNKVPRKGILVLFMSSDVHSYGLLNKKIMITLKNFDIDKVIYKIYSGFFATPRTFLGHAHFNINILKNGIISFKILKR